MSDDLFLLATKTTTANPSSTLRTPTLHNATLNPGECKAGWVTFDDPADAPLLVVFESEYGIDISHAAN